MHCPICGFEMVKKSGKRGEYFKCVNYECNFSGDTESIEGFEEFLDKDNVKLREKFLKFCFTESNEFNQINLFKNIDWLIKGKLGELLYKEYYEEFILKLDKNFLFYNFDRFIDEYENSLCIEDACNKTGIIFEKIIIWLELGNNDEKPFTYFFDKFYEVHNVKVDNQIDTFLNIFDGFNEKKALKAAKVSDVKLASWLRLNYLGYPYNKLYSKYLEIISDIDYSDCLYFDNQYMSTNTFQMLFVLSDVGKDKYADFHDDLYKIIKKQDEFEVFRPEVVIETYMKSLDFKKTNFINFLTKKNMKDFEHYLKLYLVEKKDYENDNIYKLLNFIALGYDDSIACQKSDISQELFNKWMTYQASDFPSTSLLDDYDSSLILNNYNDFINLKIDYFIELLRNGLDVHEICDRLVLFLSDVELYLNLGFMNFKPYDVFYEKYNENSIKDFYDEYELNLFLDEIKNGSFKEDTIKKLNFKPKMINKFLNKRNKGLSPYSTFYKDYNLALISNFKINSNKLEQFFDEINDNDIETSAKKVKLPLDVINYWLSLNYCRNIINESNNSEEDFFSKKSFIYDKKIFMLNIYKGKSIKQSCKSSYFDYKTIKSWIKQGKNGVEPYNQFYDDYINSKMKRS